jgi:hypothetical protein
MGLLDPIFFMAARRRHRRARWAFNHELDAYARTLSRVERAPVTGGDPSMPMPRRAAQAMPRLRREHARFREACAMLDETRDAIVQRMTDPRTPPDLSASVRRRLDPLDADHPSPERIAELEAAWSNSLERLERWAQRDPEYAAVAARRRPAAQLSATG